MMDKFALANKARWNEVTAIHRDSAFYDLAGFKSGKTSLKSIELAELGDVAGRSLLHLQCHFGMDTLSWARKGAKVTGVDFSEEAISLARSLNQELGLDATFICSDIYELPKVLAGQFDVVFTSYGIKCWLPDLTRWAKVIDHFLKPGGVFYIVESHPFVDVFDNDTPVSETSELRPVYPYFHSPEPTRWEAPGTYTGPGPEIVNTTCYEWTHGLGDILNALIGVGLRIEFVHEFPFSAYQHFPFLRQDADGWWRPEKGEQILPSLFSLRATKSQLR